MVKIGMFEQFVHLNSYIEASSGSPKSKQDTSDQHPYRKARFQIFPVLQATLSGHILRVSYLRRQSRPKPLKGCPVTNFIATALSSDFFVAKRKANFSVT